jgi:hypothetical protein
VKREQIADYMVRACVCVCVCPSPTSTMVLLPHQDDDLLAFAQVSGVTHMSVERFRHLRNARAEWEGWQNTHGYVRSF